MASTSDPDDMLAMESYQKEALAKSRMFLIKNLTLANIEDSLISKNIFSEVMMEYISVQQTNSEKIRRLLTDLARRPKSNYRRFIELLQENSEGHCATEILKREEEALKEEQERMTQRLRPRRVTSSSSVPQQVSLSLMAPTGMQQGPFNTLPSHPTTGSASSSSISTIPSSSTSSVSSTVSQETGYQESRSELATGRQEVFGPDSKNGGESRLVEMMDMSDDELDLTTADELEDRTGTSLSASSFTSSFSSTSSIYEQKRSQHEKKVYKHDSLPRGAALIINNRDFALLEKREGSDVDCHRLQDMLRHLGYEVISKQDLTAEEMKTEMENFARLPLLNDVHSCMVAILSHGEDGEKIFGVDGCDSGYEYMGYITVPQIQEILNSRNCPALKLKPKLIIVQACRGANEDLSLTPSSGGAMHARAPSVGVQRDVTKEPDERSLNPQPSQTSQTRQHPVMADFLVLYPTCPGFVAYRHIIDGSPFIKALTETFLNQAADSHVLDMVTEVNRILAEEFNHPEGHLTVSSNAHQLLRQWYLNPPPAL